MNKTLYHSPIHLQVKKFPTNFKKEAYRDGIKWKGDKIGMVSMCDMSSNVKVVAT